MMHPIPKFSATDARADEWEVRPCGMLVQKRDPAAAPAAPPAPVIRVRVKHGSAAHEIYVSSQASFGELKKLLSAPTGLHHEDQKILFKNKERPSSAFLDTCGVKDRSKLAVVEDEAARAKRCLELRKSANLEKAAKSISQIGLRVDKLANKVSALEAIVSKGERVAESDVLNLTETLMTELLKLDGVVADGDVKIQRRTQVRRVQSYVEKLDMIKMKNESLANEQKLKNSSTPQSSDASTAKWEYFDSLFSPTRSASSSTETKAKAATKPIPRKSCSPITDQNSASSPSST